MYAHRRIENLAATYFQGKCDADLWVKDLPGEIELCLAYEMPGTVIKDGDYAPKTHTFLARERVPLGASGAMIHAACTRVLQQLNLIVLETEI